MKKVSIVICTYNRADFLKRTLKSLQYQTYKDFEVIVVNGPSTDETTNVLNRYKGIIKTAVNPETNLSKSRNMGIQMSAGEIIAFIDDDAIPDEHWLDDIISMYKNDKIGGVGGRVYWPGGDHIQFETGYVDIWGDAEVRVRDANYNDPSGKRFNIMLGTNCTFLKKALLKVGGFDEYYDYFHDESDLCLRIVQAGYQIVHHKRAIIYHEFAKSHIRKDTFDTYHLNWYPIIKNKVYFAIKNSMEHASNADREAKVRWIKIFHLEQYKDWYSNGYITAEDFIDFVDKCELAYDKGYKDGHQLNRQLNNTLETNPDYLQYKAMDTGILSVCLLCKDDIFEAVGGTAKYTYELADGMSKMGHDIHVIMQGDEEADWMQAGISIHKIKNEFLVDLPELNNYPITMHNVQYSVCLYEKLVQLIDKYHIDIVESVLWDFEGAVPANLLKNRIPVLIRLQSPMLKVAETQQWELTKDLKLAADFESSVMRDSDRVIAISDHIVETIRELYPNALKDQTVDKVYLGVDENVCKSTRKKRDNTIRLLFVGRLERRKGIHTIFEILPELMSEHSYLEIHFLGNDNISDQILGMSFKEHFYKRYEKEDWAKRVTFLGQVSNDMKDQEYADCDIFLAPSLYESFGIILIEAMSAAKPVIGCKIGGMQEIIEDEVTGYTIEPENAKQLYEKLVALVENEALRHKMGKNGWNRFQKMFSKKAMVENTLKIYREAVQKRKTIHEKRNI